jgi:hypothetical protein
VSHLFDEAGVMSCQLRRELPILTHCTSQMHRGRGNTTSRFQRARHTQQREAGKVAQGAGTQNCQVYMALQANPLPSDLQ